MTYKILFTFIILSQNLCAAEKGVHHPRASSYSSYEAAMLGERGDPFLVIRTFGAEDATRKNKEGKTVAMELLSKGTYGPLSSRLNTAICHLITVAPVESFFTVQDENKKSFFFYIIQNSELTDETLNTFVSKILPSKYRKTVLSILDTQESQFNVLTVEYLRSKLRE